MPDSSKQDAAETSADVWISTNENVESSRTCAAELSTSKLAKAQVAYWVGLELAPPSRHLHSTISAVLLLLHILSN